MIPFGGDNTQILLYSYKWCYEKMFNELIVSGINERR